MAGNGHRPTPRAASPKLARVCYDVDSSSDGNESNDNDDRDSDSSSSLMILPPMKEKNANHSGLTRGRNFLAGTGSNNSIDAEVAPKQKPPLPCATTRSITNISNNSKPFSNKPTNFSIDSDSDTDDDDLLLLKSKRVFEKSKQQRQQRAFAKAKPNDYQKQRKKRECEVQKQKEKQSRIQKRKEAKEERDRLRQEEKMAKKRQSEEYNQAMGKYSHEEIAVLLDTNLYNDDPYGLVEALSGDFFVHPYQSKITEGLSSTAPSIQFIRKDKLLGGAKKAVEHVESDRARGKTKSYDDQRYEHIEYLTVLFEPDDFIPLLRRDAQEEEDDYPALEYFLDGIRSRWQRLWSAADAEPKIIFLLLDLPEALEKKWIEYGRSNRNSRRSESSLPTVKELQDAMQWILVQFQVECILCPNNEFLQSTIHKMTRGLSEKRYINQVTELECIKKIKQGCPGSNDPLEKAKDVWLRQLQQLPGLSETKAQYIIEHFPTCQSLWQAYQWEHYRQAEAPEVDGNNADAVCSVLLETKFSADNKRYKKLSYILYRVLTSNDPDEMIL